jgi:hypothetical protein
MKRLVMLLLLMPATGLPACGCGDTGGPSLTDTAIDTGDDGAGDVVPDVPVDAPADTEEDSPPDVEPDGAPGAPVPFTSLTSGGAR